MNGTTARWLFPACFSLMMAVAGPGYAQKLVRDTVSVFFDFNRSQLSSSTLKTIDSLQYLNILTPGHPVSIIGYADYVGRNGYNDSLSLQRALTVKKYLLKAGYKEKDIEMLMGKGEVAREGLASPDGYAPDRRVDLAFLTIYRPEKRPKAFRAEYEELSPEVARKLQKQIIKTPSKTAAKPSPILSRAMRAKPMPDLTTAKVNTTVTLRKLYFPSGRHYAYDDSRPEIERIYATLVANPNMRIRIEGHVCCIDPKIANDALDEDTHEYQLSVNRAHFIYKYLLDLGIPEDRLEFKGFGKTRPIIAFETTPEEGEVNRRVEIRVLRK